MPEDINSNVSVAIRLSLLEDKVDRLLTVMSDQDARQRIMEGQIAKMSVLTGFVSAGISAVMAFLIGMLRTIK